MTVECSMTVNSKMPDIASVSADEALSGGKKMLKFHVNLLAYDALLIGVCFSYICHHLTQI
jgi:hypothetical protein